MPIWRLSIVVFSALFVATATRAVAVEISGGTEADRARLAAISAQWVEAYSTGDLDGIMALMHADAMVMPHRQATSRGTAAVRDYFATRIGRPGVQFVDNLQEIRINGTWAYVLGSFEIEIAAANPEDAPITHRGRYLVLYEKVDGDWKMLRDMDNLAP